MKLVHACILPMLLAVLAPAALAEGEAGSCLVGPDAGVNGRILPQGLRAVAPTGSKERTRVFYVCQAGRVSGMKIRLVPGQAAQAILIVGGTPDHEPALVSEQGLPSDWRRVDSRRLGPETLLVTLEVAAPASAETGRVFSDRLSFGTAGAIPDVAVTLEIIAEEPLFRDEFDVDPVIGQFSMIGGSPQQSFPSVLEPAAD